MRYVSCLCGASIEGADGDKLCDAFFAHTDGEHAQIQISDARRDDLAQIIRRTSGWDGHRVPLSASPELRPLTPERADDYLRYFDGPAFADNPVWSRCYCLSYHLPPGPVDFDERPAAQNRAEKAELIARGDATGVLAYAGDEVVGWCHAAPRSTLKLLDSTPGFESDDPEHTGAIVCYVIAPQHRGQGIARKLLDGACDVLCDLGLRQVDAYPPAHAGSDATSYHGRLSMYLAAGFEQVREAGRYVVVRRQL
jgi:ribosomal protein S18 acetylase RimI-like enzyme